MNTYNFPYVTLGCNRLDVMFAAHLLQIYDVWIQNEVSFQIFELFHTNKFHIKKLREPYMLYSSNSEKIKENIYTRK